MGSRNSVCAGDNTHVNLCINEACLHIMNKIKTLELWMQSSECFECPPWKYTELTTNTPKTLVVNTTYPTLVYAKEPGGDFLFTNKYYFHENGDYGLEITAHGLSPLKIHKKPSDVFSLLFGAFIFYFGLFIMWQLTKCLRKRMENKSPLHSTEQVTKERNFIQDYSEDQPLLGELPNTYSGTASTSSDIEPYQYENDQVVALESKDISEPNRLQNNQYLYCENKPSSCNRLNSLDTFRGIAIVLMIFVNYGGGGYAIFHHAHWNGLTVADLVFPWFLWIMGVCMSISLRSKFYTYSKSVMFFKILKRSLLLFFLGIIVNSISNNNLETFRIPGVLQRFSLCYLIIGFLEVLFYKEIKENNAWYSTMHDLVISWRQWIVSTCLLVIYLVITLELPVPDCPKGYLGPGGLYKNNSNPNCTGGAAGYIDRLIFGKLHMHARPSCYAIYSTSVPYDPEGVLGILTACFLVQLGLAAGRIINVFKKPFSIVKRFFIWALICGTVAGFLCGWTKEEGFMPLNKNLWSVSFILCNACFAFILLAILYLAVDCFRIWNGNPLRYAGMNSILLYVGHEMTKHIFPWSWKPVGSHQQLLIMNLVGTTLWVIIAYICHENKVYVTI